MFLSFLPRFCKSNFIS